MISAVAAGLAAGWCGAGCESRPDARGPVPVRVVARIGEVGVSPGQFAYPRAVDFDGESFWVIDKAARVQRFSAAGEPLSLWSMPDFENGKPTGVTAAPDAQIDPTGRPVLWIPDTHYHRIIAYRLADDPHAPPREVLRFGEYGQGPGQFIYPTDIAVLHGPDRKSVSRIYVAEYGGNDRISILEHDGPDRVRFVRSFGTFGLATSPAAVEFSRPQSIAVDESRREIVITDACNHRVGRFTLDGELIAWIGSPETAGDAPGAFRYPYGLCLPGDGTALVSEFGNNRVQRLDLASGRSLGVYGRGGHGDGELAAPWGVTTARGLIFVLDSGNNRLLGFDAPGVKLAGGAP